ncbi:MAG: endopeptidase La, partial [Muribaculaceae bacterium]|nr:endopeptidase La [Muribaculaceae bacterium]
LSTLSQPLLDRMEIIDISGYLMEEKIEIARQHLIPKLLKENLLTDDNISFTDDALSQIIENYTAESGVRQLEKKIAAIIRKIILRKMSGQDYEKIITPEVVREFLGVPLYSRDKYEGNEYPGVVTGLAWTANGGEILFIETSLSKGKGEKLTLTGNLGDVMKESAVIALEYVKAHAETFNIDPSLFEKYNVHIHVPEGAVPKDGPSAGITITTSLVSAFKQCKVKPFIAMTGEMTLRGKVLPVGGIKEKMLAAKRAGIKEIILSSENRKNVDDIPERYRENLTFHFVDNIEEVISLAVTDVVAEKALTL